MSMGNLKRRSAVAGIAWLLATILAVSASAVSAQIAFTDVSADVDFGRDRPRVARDADGNYHLVYRKGDPDTSLSSSSLAAVGYMMVGRNGDVLIDEVDLIANASNGTQSVDVAVGSDGKVYVIYVLRTDDDLRFVRLDPSLAAQDGSSVPLATIEDVAETVFAGTYKHPVIKLDADDNAYIWDHLGTFLKLDSDGNALITATEPFTGVDNDGHASNPMALDSDGNAHVVFQDCDSNLCTVSYGMIDGTTGDVLINQTNVVTELSANDDAPHAVHYQVLVDSKDKVHLVWVDKRGTPNWDNYCTQCASGGILRYAKLDPSLDDQDGSAADMTAIKLIGDLELGPFKYVQAYMDRSSGIHLFWGQRGGMSHMRLNTSGKIVKPPSVLSNRAVAMTSWNKAYPAAMASDGRVFWPTVDDSVDGVGTKIVTGRVSVGGGGGGGSTAPGLLLLVMGAAALRRRTAR